MFFGNTRDAVLLSVVLKLWILLVAHSRAIRFETRSAEERDGLLAVRELGKGCEDEDGNAKHSILYSFLRVAGVVVEKTSR